MIRQLKEELQDAKREDKKMNLEYKAEAEKNREIKAPFEKALANIVVLKTLAIKHEKIKSDLATTQQRIFECLNTFSELEWEYEVKR